MPRLKTKSPRICRKKDKMRKRAQSKEGTTATSSRTTLQDGSCPVSSIPQSAATLPKNDSSSEILRRMPMDLAVITERLVSQVDDREIPDDVINAALHLMKTKCSPDLAPYIGYYQPAEIMLMMQDSSTLRKPPIPHFQFSINIHPLQGHWVTSFQCPTTELVYVYDSMMSPAHYKQTEEQIKIMYTAHSTAIRYIPVTQQGQTTLCGVMTIAFAFSCLLGKNPATLTYDISRMRQHLKDCLLNADVSEFPILNLLHHENRGGTDIGQVTQSCSDRLKNYFKDQQAKRNQVAERKKLERARQDELQLEKIRSQDRGRKHAKWEQLSSIEKEKIQEKDRNRKAQVRKGMMVKAKQELQEKDRARKMHERKNMTPINKQKGQEKDKIRKMQERKSITSPEKQKVQENDKTRKVHERKNMPSIKKQKTKEKDKTRKGLERKNTTAIEKQNGQEKDKTRKVHERKNMTPVKKQRMQEKDRARKGLESAQKTPVEKQMLQEKERIKKVHERKNMTPIKKQKVKEKDKTRKVHERKNMTSIKKQKVQEKDKTRKVHEREITTPSERLKFQQKDSTRKAQKRKNFTPIEKVLMQEQNRCSRIKRRKMTSDLRNSLFASYISTSVVSTTHEGVQVVLQDFFSAISDGPTYKCCRCNRFLYRSNVQHSIEKTKWICITCKKAQDKGKVPAQAYDNNLQLDAIPTDLKELFPLEKQLICKIIPFMKIVSLPKGAQHGLKGQVVLVPSNVEKTATALPRQTSEAQIVALQLKRRLSDHAAYVKQFIRPFFVNKGLQYLLTNNQYYSDILQNGTWAEESKHSDSQFWNAVIDTENSETSADTDRQSQFHSSSSAVEVSTCSSNVKGECQPGSTGLTGAGKSTSSSAGSQSYSQTPSTEDDIVDSEDEVDNANPSSFVEDLHMKRSLNSITCIYPESGPSVKSSDILNVAPAEGQIPTSIFYQDHWETLAFPSLFPTGKNTFHEPRKISLTPKKYVNARLLSADGRFAESPEYTFQCLHWVESTVVKDTISMALKKNRQGDISVGQLRNPDHLRTLMKDEELYTSFKKVRGSPQYWKEMQLDMMAKIRQFGSYTFFLTGSAADFHWPELVQIVARQYGEDYDISYIETEMDKKTKRQWLARNPATIARHIDFIFRKLWGNVILSGLHPIGQILNYDIRKEMQNRGTAHFHSAVHVHNAPVLDNDSDEAVISFIDKYISCALPSPNKDETLAALVSSRQTHHHTRTCKKKPGLNCRFHFPKPPSQNTVISRLPDENTKEQSDFARQVISKVMETLDETGTDITMTDLLEKAEVAPEVYDKALHTALRKTTIILKRQPNETCINPCNPVILKALRANMDIQYITDVWACIAYITSYMCKPEKSMSDLMRNACKEAQTAKEKLKSIGNVFLKSREVSQHEAIARLLGLPLRESNIPVIFIPTGYPQERTRMLKPRSVLDRMHEDDNDIFLPNIIDKYAARPLQLEDMCLSEFAANYTSVPTKSQNEDENVDEPEKDNTLSNERICLMDELGTMIKRKSPVVLRYYNVSQTKDSEKYHHRLLLLYLPWRQEGELNNFSRSTYEEIYKKVSESIQDNIAKCEPYLQDVENATEQLEGMEDDDVEIWDNLAPQAEQDREEESHVDPEFGHFDTENLTEEQRCEQSLDGEGCRIPSSKNHILTSSIKVISPEKYYSMVRSLNDKQKQVHDFVLHWCRSVALSSNEDPKPFHVFLSGGAGVGKSHTIHTIYQTALRELRKPGDNPDSPTVVLTAPTGKAAVNIGGNTLHSAFHLPVKQRGSHSGYHKPSAATLNSMRASYCQMKILIIDEVSKVGAQTLSNVDLTLQDIFENNQPFGGISVLAVGDLMQLNPVGEAPVYKGITKGYGALAPNIWHLFSMHELTSIVRQKEDPKFAEILSRIRIGQQSQDDIEEIQKLHINETVPTGCISIFLTNELKEQYNNLQLNALDTEIYTAKAKDSSKDMQTRRASVTVTSTNPHETAGLAAEVQLAVNARYILSKNTDIEDGLVNGATGTIRKIEVPPSSPLKGTIYVEFDDPKVGISAKKKSKYKDLVPIQPVTAMFSLTDKSKSVQVERTQYPGTLAWGITVHKSQGSTFQQMIADMTTTNSRKATMPGQIYTMLSRAKSRQGLKVCAFEPSKIKVNASALQEMNRLKLTNTLSIDLIPQMDETFLTVSYLNVRSLKTHFVDVKQDITIKQSDIVCLVETKVDSYDRYSFGNMTPYSTESNHGCVIYSRLEVKKKLEFKTTCIESVGIVTSHIIVLCLYIPPSSSWNLVKDELIMIAEKCKEERQSNSCDTVLIVGDFNIDAQKDVLQTLFGLQQLIKMPTHVLGGILDLAFTNKIDEQFASFLL